MDYQKISIDDLATYYLDDPGGFLYVAITKKSYPSLHDVLSVFRKSYISTTTDEFNPLIEETQYNTFIREMESLKTEQKTNKDWYYLAIGNWGSEVPNRLNNIYKEDKYVSHISFRDVSHEGIYESVTKFQKYYLYWCYG